MNNLLIVDERFPYTGGTRTEKLIKYLPDFGWNPVVLTINQEKTNPFAAEILKGYKNHPLRIYNTDRPLNFSFLRRFHMGRLGTVLNRLLFIPDTNISWIPHALIKASKIFQKEKPSIIYSTSPQEGIHLLANLIRLKYRKPWVADFRDLWTLCDGRYRPLTFLHHHINEYLEKSIYRKWSDLIIANTEENKRIIVDHFHADPKKIKVVTNGFDPVEIKCEKPETKNRHFTLGYFGAFDKPMTCHKEFLISYNKALSVDNRFNLDVWAVVSERLKRSIKKNPLLNEHITFHEYLSHQDSMRELASTDALVIMLKKIYYYVTPQKLYNYLALNKPILAIVPPDGCAAKVIRKTNCGIVVSPDNTNEIAYRMLELREKWEKGILKINENHTELMKYRSDYLVKKLATILTTLKNSCP